jgi:hypothetical protein
MLKLLENAKIRAFDKGKEEGYYEGYEEGRSLASEDKQSDGVFEILRREDEEKARNTAFEQGRKEGEEHGRTAERESWETSHGPDKCEERRVLGIDTNVQAVPMASVTTDSSIQTTSTTTVDINTQTATHNETPTSPSSAPSTPSQPPSATSTPPSTLSTLSTTATTTQSPASKQSLAPRKRWDTSTEPPEQPQPQPHLPSLAHTAQKCVVSPPHAPHTISTSPTTPSTPVDDPRLLPVLSALSVDLALPQLTRKRAVSTPSAPSAATGTAEPHATVVLRPPSVPEPPPSPTLLCPIPAHPRFDWAEDTELMPAPPNMYPWPWDLSILRTGHAQPFGALRRRTRRRQAPPRAFPPVQRFVHSDPLFYVRPSYPRPFVTRRHPSGIGPGKPIITVPFGTPAPAPSVVNLDWDQDPRLVNLSQALRSSGMDATLLSLYCFISYITPRNF